MIKSDGMIGGDELSGISEISERFQVTHRSLRFYEDKGLLSPTRIGTTRLYSKDDQIRIKAILVGKRFGFSLREIKSLIDTPDGKECLTLARFSAALDADLIAERIKALEIRKRYLEESISELRQIIQIQKAD